MAVSKKEFIKEYLDSYPRKITTWFKREEFLRNPNIQIKEKQVYLGDFKSYFHPWMYKGDRSAGAIEGALKDSTIMPIRLCETDKVDLDSERKKKIELLQNQCIRKLLPFPIITDTNFRQSLILDGNHTLSSLQRKGANLLIPVVEILGEKMSEIVSNFKIIQRG